MNRTIKTLGLALPVAVVALIVVNQRSGQTALQAAPAQAGEPAAHLMTAAEHIAHMAAAGDIHAGHALEELSWTLTQAAPDNLSLPADDMGAAARLASSPRKGEFVTIDVGGTPMRTWVVHPAGSAPAPVVVVIQEVFGLSDWIRGVADQLAAEGFIAVAPDLLAGHGPNGSDSSAFASQQDAVQATLQLPADEIITRLKAARTWGLALARANGKSGTVGFCFGGNQSFAMAVNEPSLDAAVVYYGAAPTDVPAAPRGRGAGGRGTPPPPFVASDSLTRVSAPVLGLYGGLMEDARIGNTIAPTEAKMKEFGKTYEPHIFDGAAHGFLRAQTGNDGANMKATEQAWSLTVGWLKKYTS